MAMNALIDIGKLSKPATVFVEKISDAIGALWKPNQIRRIARAKADARVIEAEARFTLSEIERRGLERLAREEGKRQENIESIASAAVPLITDDSAPENLKEDWVLHFFERSKMISNTEMQAFWSRVLAGQANGTSSFSKRTLDLAATLDKDDMESFTRFATTVWNPEEPLAIVYESNHVEAKFGYTYASLANLDDAGLIRFQPSETINLNSVPRVITLNYGDRPVTLKLQKEYGNRLSIGNVLLTSAGRQLYPICGAVTSEPYLMSVIERWANAGYSPTLAM